MLLDSLRLQHFRSYDDEGFEFDPGVNIIVGPNASGKTNLLEAMLVASRGSSFRAKDAELIKFDEDWGRIDVSGPGGSRSVKLRQENNLIKKDFDIGGKPLKRLSLTGSIPVVLFEPNHLLLLHGSPEARRDYLDDLLEQLVPGYAKTRRDYRRIVAQRNSLLKRGLGTQHQLFAWNVRLSEVGATLARERYALVEKLHDQIDQLYKALAQSDKTTVGLRYITKFPIESYSSSLLHALEKQQDIDIERGFTTLGPHREDFLVTLDEHEAAETASRGETRTVLLALKIMELELLEEARGQRPLLLLDDVFSELDGKRRKALTDSLRTHQTFITTTDADIVLHHFTDDCRIISLV